MNAVEEIKESETPTKFSGIYSILNVSNGDFYIGSAIDLKIRWRLHRNELNRNEHCNRYLQFAWNKYWGNFKFVFTVLEYCEPENLIQREQYYIDTLKPKYNLAPVAGNMFGYKHTEEAKRKMSEFHSNRTEETRKRISESLTGKKQTKQHIERMILSKKGFKHSEEAKKKIGEKNKVSLKNRKLSEEHKKTISEAHKKRLFPKFDPNLVIHL